MSVPIRPGLTVPLPGHLHSHADGLRELADLGYTDIWSAEVDGADAFTPLALAAAWEPRLRLVDDLKLVRAKKKLLKDVTGPELLQRFQGIVVAARGALVEGQQQDTVRKGSYRMVHACEFRERHDARHDCGHGHV